MDVVDRKTGKRLVPGNKKPEGDLRKSDPIRRNAEKDLEMEEHSPMDPPEAYDGAVIEGVSYDQMHKVLQNFMDEHKKGIEKIDRFEQALAGFKENHYGLTQEINEVFSEFFHYFDHHILDHNQREEHQLFPLLHKKLMESDEHGEGPIPRTAVDMMEDDHIKFIQLGALAFNMLGLAARLPDERSRMFVYDTAFNSARELIEMLRLHIYREDHILFPLAHQLLTTEEFNAIIRGEIGPTSR
ncbi:MAG: hemerythrin domain-containing protein [Flavobacteriales bacterium]|nr:hemerythrin domain-containing protein [Flavobacteriales bacterium]MCB9447309.1 hemerythrin domain-containing protein [Flavobacteriales bacterium]